MCLMVRLLFTLQCQQCMLKYVVQFRNIRHQKTYLLVFLLFALSVNMQSCGLLKISACSLAAVWTFLTIYVL